MIVTAINVNMLFIGINGNTCARRRYRSQHSKVNFLRQKLFRIQSLLASPQVEHSHRQEITARH